VERRDQRCLLGGTRDGGRHTLAQLVRGLVGEGDGQRLIGPQLPAAHLVGDASDHGAGLARSRTRHHQQRPVGGGDRSMLIGIELNDGFGAIRCAFPVRTPGHTRVSGAALCRAFHLPGGWLLHWQCGPRQQAHLASQALLLTRREDLHRAELAVVARRNLQLAAAHSAHRLGRRRSGDAGDPLERGLAQDHQLGTDSGQQPVHLGAHRLAARADAEHLAHDLVQGHEPLEASRHFRTVAGRPIRQLLHPAHHPHGELAAAVGAATVQLAGPLRLEAQPALAVAVKVVFALLGVELDGAEKSATATQGSEHGAVGRLDVQQVGLAAELGRRVGVGAGDQGESIQTAHAPVHWRVRRQPGLGGEDVTSEVTEALLDRVESRLGAEHRKPRCPDMCRYKKYIFGTV